ncbi:MAG: hypothetical protein RR911_06495 [Oscillospiraceae bacterium]
MKCRKIVSINRVQEQQIRLLKSRRARKTRMQIRVLKIVMIVNNNAV